MNKCINCKFDKKCFLQDLEIMQELCKIYNPKIKNIQTTYWLNINEDDELVCVDEDFYDINYDEIENMFNKIGKAIYSLECSNTIRIFLNYIDGSKKEITINNVKEI